MDPNNLARVVVPRPLNNFLDNLPSEERLASDGFWTLVEPTKKLVKETKEDIAERVHRLCLGASAEQSSTQALLEDAPSVARGGTLAAECLDAGQEAIEWVAAGGGSGKGSKSRGGGGGGVASAKTKTAASCPAVLAIGNGTGGRGSSPAQAGKQGNKNAGLAGRSPPGGGGSSVSSCSITRCVCVCVCVRARARICSSCGRQHVTCDI